MTDPVYQSSTSITLRRHVLRTEGTCRSTSGWPANAPRRGVRVLRVGVPHVCTTRMRWVSGSIYASTRTDWQVLDRSAGEQHSRPAETWLRTKWLAEDWDELCRLVAADTLIADKQEVLAMMKWEGKSRHPPNGVSG